MISQRHSTRKTTYFIHISYLKYNIRTFYRFGAVIGNDTKMGLIGEQVYAIKTINKVRVIDKTSMIQEEFDILKKMDHPNIFRFYVMYKDDMFIYFVMIYLHSQDVMHRDLKLENILNDTEIKIVDFSLSKKLKELDKDRKQQLLRKQSQLGTLFYECPEVVTGLLYYTMFSTTFLFKTFIRITIKAIVYLRRMEINKLGLQEHSLRIKTKRLTCSEALNSDWAKKVFRKSLQIQINQNQGNIIQSNDCTPVNNTNIKGLKRYAKSKQFKREIFKMLQKEREEQIYLQTRSDLMMHNGKMSYNDFCQLMHDDMESDQFFEKYRSISKT